MRGRNTAGDEARRVGICSCENLLSRRVSDGADMEPLALCDPSERTADLSSAMDSGSGFVSVHFSSAISSASCCLDRSMAAAWKGREPAGCLDRSMAASLPMLSWTSRFNISLLDGIARSLELRGER